MLQIRAEIDLNWLIRRYNLRYANHCDEPGKYIFYSDTLYINPYDRIIHIEGRNYEDILFLYQLISNNLVIENVMANNSVEEV